MHTYKELLKENRLLKEENRVLKTQVANLEARIGELKALLRQNSQNSSRPQTA